MTGPLCIVGFKHVYIISMHFLETVGWLTPVEHQVECWGVCLFEEIWYVVACGHVAGVDLATKTSAIEARTKRKYMAMSFYMQDKHCVSYQIQFEKHLQTATCKQLFFGN